VLYVCEREGERERENIYMYTQLCCHCQWLNTSILLSSCLSIGSCVCVNVCMGVWVCVRVSVCVREGGGGGEEIFFFIITLWPLLLI